MPHVHPSLPRWTYPWTGLEDSLRAIGQPLRLIGYGSLLNPASARVTLRSVRHPDPVLAMGVTRVFDYPISDLATRRYGQGDPLGHAVLNVHPSSNGHTVGGVLFDVDPTDIASLRAREVDYDLLPVCFRPFGASADVDAAHAYILHRPAPPSCPLAPHPRYYRLCRDGAAALGQAFLDHYLDSTFLQDRVTTIRAWERGNAECGMLNAE